MKNESLTVQSPVNIFIVENNKLYLRLLEYIFTKNFNYRFYNHKSEEEVIRHLNMKPRLVIVDYSLPGGYDMIRHVRKNEKDCHIIVLMNQADKQLTSDIIAAGANDYVMKGEYEVDELVEKTETYLSGKAPAKAAENKFRKPSIRQLCYFMLILMIVTAGIYYYQQPGH